MPTVPKSPRAGDPKPASIPTGPQRAPRGSERSCQTWAAEAALRMLMNNLDPDVAERPDDLVVYGGSGRAARSWPAFAASATAWTGGLSTTRRS